MIGIEKLQGIFIIENGARFIERYAMLFDVSLFLQFVPLKPQLIHMYIVLMLT